jgi:hypothetical protein
VIPHAKNGKDQSLEVEARFQIARSGIWLLDRVESRFRGDGGGSTGMVSVVTAEADSFAPVSEMLAKANATEQMLAAIREAPEGRTRIEPPLDTWRALPFKAVWTDAALKSAGSDEDRPQSQVLIGITRVRGEPTPAGGMQITLEGVSTMSWKEFETEWKVGWLDASGRTLATAATNMVVRAENAPSPFVVDLTAPPFAGSAPARSVMLEGTVKRMSGAYHGHGRWMTFARPD